MVLVLFASQAVGSVHDLKSNHEVSSFKLTQDDSADAGEDAKAADLTDSIQGLFSDSQAAPAASTKTVATPSTHAKASKKNLQPAPTKVKSEAQTAQKKSQAIAIKHGSEAKIPAKAPMKAKVAVKAAKKAHEVKVAAKTMKAVKQAPEAKATTKTGKKTTLAKPAALKKQKAALLSRGAAKPVVAAVAPSVKVEAPKAKKDEKPKVVPPVQKMVQQKEKAKKGITAGPQTKAAKAAKAAKALPTKLAAKPKETADLKKAVPKQAASKTKELPLKSVKAVSKPAVAKTAQSNAVTPTKAAEKGKGAAGVKSSAAVTSSKPKMKVKLAPTLATRATDTGNLTTALRALKSKDSDEKNKTKVIEEAVVSLPMASFALGPPKPEKNTTKPKSAGNSTQKTADETREQYLENEIATLKARLANKSQPAQIKDAPALKPTAKSSNVHVEDLEHAKQQTHTETAKVEKPVEVTKAPVPMHAEPKPTPAAVPAASLRKKAHPKKAKAEVTPAPPTDDLEQERLNWAQSMGGASALTQAEVIDEGSSQAEVIEDESATADAASTATTDAASQSEKTVPASLSWWGWISSFFWKPAAAVAPKPAAAVAPKKTALLEARHRRFFKQDMQRTAEATKEESQHIIQVNDAWSQMEQEDNAKEEQVRREDAAERERAETPESPHTPNKGELHGRHGADMSTFWSKLEKEDYGIEHSVDTEDLNEYERLTKEQNTQVEKAAEQVKDNRLSTERDPPLKHADDKLVAIHEPWLRREERDKEAEKKIHDSPDLQMLQLRHRHRRSK